MAEYTVGVNRVAYQHHDFKVKAETDEEAIEKAKEMAENYFFDKDNFARYEIDFCTTGNPGII